MAKPSRTESLEPTLRPSRPWLLAVRVSELLFLRWLVLVASAVVFLSLAGGLVAGGLDWLDRPLIELSASLRGEGLTRGMLGLTWCGNGLTLTLLAALVTLALFFARARADAAFLAAASIGAGALNALLKLAFSRPRPLVLAHLSQAGGYSFPSGHAMASAAIYAAVALVIIRRFPRARWPVTLAFGAFVFGIGASRVYLGVHYPSDVLAGFALGLSWPLWLAPLLLPRRVS
ncbi:MAG: phosphatase PAP2 family protein [Polyangiaceae bacterium]